MSAPINVISGGLERGEVERRIAGASPGWKVEIEREIYYPYHWVLLRYAASTLLGKSAVPIWVVVDARTRIAATTDPFELAPVEREQLKTTTIVDPQVPATDAVGIAQRYAAYVMRNRHKALVVPQVDLLEQDLVYKPMSTVRLSREGEQSFRVLVDAMSGAFHALSTTPRDTIAPRPQRLM